MSLCVCVCVGQAVPVAFWTNNLWKNMGPLSL